MKKKHLLSSLLFLYGICCIAQNNLTGIETWRINAEGTLEPVSKNVMEYDQFGNEISKTRFYWSAQFLEVDLLNEYDVYYQEISTYNDQNLLSSYVYKSLGSGSGYKKEVTYYYNDNCQEVQHEEISYHEELFKRNITYFNSETCQIDSIEKFEFDGNNNPEQFYVERYYYDQNEELRVLFGKDTLGGFTNELFYDEITRNDMGLITRLYSSFTDIGPTLYLAEYNQYGDRTYRTYYDARDTNDLKLNREYIHTHTYNDDGQILETSTVSFDYTFGSSTPFITTSSFIYEYFCDGLLHKRTNTSASGTNSITFYQYQQGHDCGIPEEEKKVSVRPNFTQDFVIIESELLLLANSFIAVYDMSGRRLLQIPTDRIQQYLLNLGDLPPGHYVIQVFNDEYSETTRIVKI